MKKKATMWDQLGFWSWGLTALASINIGLIPFGKDILSFPMVQENFAALVVPMHYLIGLAGLLSFVMFIQVWRAGMK